MPRYDCTRRPATSLPTASLAGCVRFHRMFNRLNDADMNVTATVTAPRTSLKPYSYDLPPSAMIGLRMP